MRFTVKHIPFCYNAVDSIEQESGVVSVSSDNRNALSLA